MYHSQDSQGSGVRTGALIPGLILVGVGVLFLLDNLNIIYARDFVRYWPVILIAAGLAKLVDAPHSGGRPAGVILLLVGSVFLVDNLGLLHLGFRALWPLALIAMGLMLLWQRLSPETYSPEGTPRGAAGGLNETAVFGGCKRVLNTDDFKGGQVSAVFGGVELDLRRAGIRGDSATIDISAIFGGVEIRIPQNWSAVMHGTAIFGGYEDKANQPDPASPDFKRLIVKGAVVFGGCEIKN
jgi:predicted membrane protein